MYEWIINALNETWNAVFDVLKEEPESSFDAATPCPGWTVRDVVSHLVGFELMLQGEPIPDVDFEMPGHVRNPIGEFNERFIEQRRTQPGAAVLAEFRRVTAASLERLRALRDDDWLRVGWSPEGEAPYHRFQETRLLDSWIHLQDIRDALAMPEDDHGVAEEVVVNRFEAALPYVIGKKASAPEHSTVRVNLVGRLARTVSLRVEGGRARAVTTIEDTPSVELTMPVALFWRRAAGRISAAALLSSSAVHVEGDGPLAHAICEALAIMI